MIEYRYPAIVQLEVIRADPSLDGVPDRIHRIAEIPGRDPSSVLAELDADLGRASDFAAKAQTHPRALVLLRPGPENVARFRREHVRRNNAASRGSREHGDQLRGVTNVTSLFASST